MLQAVWKALQIPRLDSLCTTLFSSRQGIVMGYVSQGHTDKLQSSSKAQCSSKRQHTFWIDEEDPGVLADMPAGVRHVIYLLCVL